MTTPTRVLFAQAAFIERVKTRDIAKLLVERIKSRLVSLKQRKKQLDGVKSDIELTAWCADFSEELSGEVGTIEIPGEGTQKVIIHPGHGGAATYAAQRDGLLWSRLQMSPEQAYLSAALLPGWQKFKPTYRIGTLTANDTNAHIGSVSLSSALSSAQRLGINQTTTLTGVPIEYMDCNADAFEVGDSVLVRFDDQDWTKPKIIGFASEPKECCVDRWIKVLSGIRLMGLATDQVGVWIAIPQWSSSIRRSEDDGKSWTSMNVGVSNLMGVDTDRNGVWVIVSIDGKILRSADNGLTWTVSDVLPPDPGWGTPSKKCCDVATDGAGTWLIVMWDAYPLRSNDNGLNWHRYDSSEWYWRNFSTGETIPIGFFQPVGRITCNRNGRWVMSMTAHNYPMVAPSGLDSVWLTYEWSDPVPWEDQPDQMGTVSSYVGSACGPDGVLIVPGGLWWVAIGRLPADAPHASKIDAMFVSGGLGNVSLDTAVRGSHAATDGAGRWFVVGGTNVAATPQTNRQDPNGDGFSLDSQRAPNNPENGYILESTDNGLTWAYNEYPGNGTVKAVEHNGHETWVAVGYDGIYRRCIKQG